MATITGATRSEVTVIAADVGLQTDVVNKWKQIEGALCSIASPFKATGPLANAAHISARGGIVLVRDGGDVSFSEKVSGHSCVNVAMFSTMVRDLSRECLFGHWRVQQTINNRAQIRPTRWQKPKSARNCQWVCVRMNECWHKLANMCMIQ
jgi:hypothetical protein